MKRLFLVFLLVIFCLPLCAGAADDAADKAVDDVANLPLSTDRPSFSDGASTVPVGHAQFEFGLQFDHGEDADALSLAMPLVRYGMTEGTELRLAVPALQMVWPQEGNKETNLGNLDLGFRFIYRMEDLGTVGFQPMVSFPLRSQDYDDAGVDVSLKLLWAIGLTDWMEVAGNLGIIFTGLGSDAVQDQAYLASLVLGFSLAENWGAFVEGYGLIPDSSPESAAAGFNVGAVWRLASSWQVDLVVGSDLNASQSVSVGAGAAYLW